MKFKKSANITNLLTLKVSDAVCDLFIPENIDDIVQFSYNEKDFHILSGGSNIIAGKIKKPVLYMADMIGESVTEECEESVLAYMPAGTRIDKLLNYLTKNGLSGPEFMAGIPGTLGGAIIGNAAPKGYSWDGIVNSIVIAENGEVRKFKPVFGYRTLLNKPKNPFIILAVELILKKSSTVEIKKSIKDFSQKRIKIPYPSAGSLFKNPPEGFAASFIELSGCKGFNFNDAAIFEKHANIVINRGNATEADFIELHDYIVGEVYVHFGIILEHEVHFWK